MADITNEQHVNTTVQRLRDIDFDFPFDATMIEQFISDNSNSPSLFYYLQSV